MIEINIPGRANLNLEHLVMDVNGTIAVDGVLIDGVLDRINSLHGMLTIHLLTANTHGGQDQIDSALNLRSIRIKQGYEKEQKADYVERLGKEKVVAIGQGMNDAWMLRAAELGICVLSLKALPAQQWRRQTCFCQILLPPWISSRTHSG